MTEWTRRNIDVAVKICAILEESKANIGNCCLYGYYYLDSINYVILVSRDEELTAPYVVWNVNLSTRCLYQGRYFSNYESAKKKFAEVVAEQ